MAGAVAVLLAVGIAGRVRAGAPRQPDGSGCRAASAVTILGAMKSRREPEPVLLGSLEEQVMLAVIRTGDDAYGMNVRRELER